MRDYNLSNSAVSNLDVGHTKGASIIVFQEDTTVAYFKVPECGWVLQYPLEEGVCRVFSDYTLMYINRGVTNSDDISDSRWDFRQQVLGDVGLNQVTLWIHV